MRALVRGRAVYLVPLRDDRAHRRRHGGGEGLPEHWSRPGGVYELLRDAIEVVPGLAEWELAESLVRFRPGTPDNAPILGPSGLPGLILATGHYRNGVLLTPVTADAIADLVTTGDPARTRRGLRPRSIPVRTGAQP